jgi:hypothetical protein
MNYVTCFLSSVQSVKRVKMLHPPYPLVWLLRIWRRLVLQQLLVPTIGTGTGIVAITGPPGTENQAGTGDMTEGRLGTSE